MAVRTEEIRKIIPEEGTAVFRCTCLDESGNASVPTAMHWDLTALDGTVIAYNQEVADLAAVMYITVYGTNLRMLEGEESFGERLITFRGTYNSTYGNNLPIHKQVKFRVQNLKLIGYPLSVDVQEMVFTSDESVDIAAA